MLPIWHQKIHFHFQIQSYWKFDVWKKVMIISVEQEE